MLINARFMLIIVLSLWLPVQSLASVLLQCERIADTATKAATDLVVSRQFTTDSNIATEPAGTVDCHGTAILPTTSSADKHDQSDRPDCYHCDDSCHASKTLSMPSAHQLTGLPTTRRFLNLHQTAADGYAVSLQRPPCKLSLA